MNEDNPPAKPQYPPRSKVWGEPRKQVSYRLDAKVAQALAAKAVIESTSAGYTVSQDQIVETELRKNKHIKLLIIQHESEDKQNETTHWEFTNKPKAR